MVVVGDLLISVENIDGMIVTGWNQSALRQTCLSATSDTTDPMWTGLGLNLGLHGEGMAANHLRWFVAH